MTEQIAWNKSSLLRKNILQNTHITTTYDEYYNREYLPKVLKMPSLRLKWRKLEVY
jgi:hypothetical protein